MKIVLNRNKIFLISLAIIFIYLLLNRLDYIIGSETTTGEVIEIKTWNSRGRNFAPIINFKAGEYSITFQGETNMDVERGEKLKIIYKIADPTNAQVYSFVGFWLTPLIYTLIPLMLLTAAVFSFLGKSEILTMHFGKHVKFVKSETDSKKLIGDK